MSTSSPRLRRKEASTYLEEQWGLSVAPTTLTKYATVGGGPAYAKFGRLPVYSPSDLDQWAQSKLGPTAASSTEHEAVRAAAA